MTPNQTEPTAEEQARNFAMSNLTYPMIAGLASTKFASQKYSDQNIKDLVQKYIYGSSFNRQGDPDGLIYGWLEEGFDASTQPIVNREYLMNKAEKIVNESFSDITTTDYIQLLGINPEQINLREDVVGKYINELENSASTDDQAIAKELKLNYQAHLASSSAEKAMNRDRQIRNIQSLENLVQPTGQNGLAGRARA